jgi:type II secretion system protein G
MNKKGFTLIELLIVVAIIGIIAAIAIPNLLVALQKGKQKATMGDMKTLGGAVESYVTDWSFVPDVANITDLNNAANGLIPFFIKVVPTTDGWGTEYQYLRDAANQDFYSFTSYGRDKAASGPVATASGTYYDCTQIADFDSDIVYANGGFTFGPRTKK